MILKTQVRRYFLATVSLQAFLLGYAWLAPWEQVNGDIESLLEETAYDDVAVTPLPAVEVPEPLPSPRRRKLTDVAVRTHTVKKGENFSKIWSRYAGNLDRFPEAVAAFERAGLKRCSFKAGERVEIAVRNDGIIRRVKTILPDGHRAILKTGEAGNYVATVEEPKIRLQQKVVTASIYGSFIRSAVAASVPYKVIDEVVDLFGNKVDFSRDLHPGDTFSVVYEERRVKGKEEPLAVTVEAASLKVSGKFYAVIRHDGRDGKAHYFNEKGELLGNYFLRYPVKFTRISSVFSTSRFHPILNISTPHPGVDLAAPIGTPVRTIAEGLVTHAAFSRGAGNMIRIKHGSNVESIYMHLSKFAKGLKAGMRVERGQVIGNVGSTGLSTGPHLDYRLSINSKFVNPLTTSLPQILNLKDAIPSKLLQARVRELNARHDNMAIAQRDIDAPRSRA